jgi:hypothetical protein
VVHEDIANIPELLLSLDDEAIYMRFIRLLYTIPKP